MKSTKSNKSSNWRKQSLTAYIPMPKGRGLTPHLINEATIEDRKPLTHNGLRSSSHENAAKRLFKRRKLLPAGEDWPTGPDTAAGGRGRHPLLRPSPRTVPTGTGMQAAASWQGIRKTCPGKRRPRCFSPAVWTAYPAWSARRKVRLHTDLDHEEFL